MTLKPDPLAIAVVGVGHLGKEHARILSTFPKHGTQGQGAGLVDLVGVVDPNLSQAEAVASRCGTRAYVDHRDLLDTVSAVVVAAPTCYHHSVARDFLEHGVSVLVEKPLAVSAASAAELVQLAESQGVVLQVGHIERFNPAFEEIQHTVERVLTPKWITCERLGSFSGRSTDVGVVLDLMIHDLDLILSLNSSGIMAVEAMGVAVLGGHEDIARARVTFADGCVADLHASRVHHEAVRRMQLWGAEGWINADFGTRKVMMRQPGDTLRQGRLDSRRLDPAMLTNLKNDLHTRYIQSEEVDCSQRHSTDQLTRELEEFVAAVQNGVAPRVEGRAGLEALELADRILDALRAHSWEGRVDGAGGPHRLPASRGRLFVPARELMGESITDREAA